MKKLFTLAAVLLLMGTLSAQQYSLVKVTEVKDGGLYVIERNGYVLDASIQKDAVQTTKDYLTTALTGKESYVFKLEANETEGFSIRSEKKYADDPTGHIYLNNPTSTKMTFSNSSTSEWVFEFTGETAFITNAANKDKTEGKNRFLGETSEGSNAYKAYAQSNIDTYGHNFTVYELQVSTAPFINVTPAAADFGTKAVGDKAVSMEITVSFGNLKGEITYTALASPFSVSGSLAESGDKLTITANPATEGKYSQTLTIKSEADNVSAQVSVKLNVADLSGGFVKMSGKVVEGDYVITYGEYAMKAFIQENAKQEKVNRFDVATFTVSGDVLVDPAADIIWHIASVGDHWTLYNESTGKYAASTDAKNKGTLVDDATTDNAKWNITVTEANTYEFENVARAASSQDSGNKWLRNNNTYGFACYAENTGGPLTLYRLGATPTAVDQVEAEVKVVKVVEEGRIVIIRDGIRYNAQGVRLQ